MKSLYEQVYESLKQEIVAAKYKPGDRVPSEKELSDAFHVSRITSKKALEKLMNEGYVYRQRGKGTFVSESPAGNGNGRQDKPLFGLIVTTFDDSFGSGVITAIERASEERCLFILKCSLGDPEREERILKELLDYGVDGLIVFPAQAEHYSSEILRMVVDKFPLVLIDRSFKGVAATSVSTANEEAAKTGIDYLFELGHEQIGVLAPANFEATTIEDRLDGIVEAFAEKQVVVSRDLWCSALKSTLPTPLGSKEADIESIKTHLKEHPQITALFALEYNIAILAKTAIEQLGLSVPEDISILCFDSPPWNELEWNFTHLKQRETELGKLAVERLLNMYYEETGFEKDRLPAELVIGSSTKKLKVKHPSS
ncbi:GntR family transcriptional regulator [Sediminibacillus halophilus]|uniref:DNA-binding transcriptional regulator, LacI/PurR family n=1 Tax=Sediminibacillus halophilus TaxID=482461 RepID=A0A1G9UFX3_9BACI|nr:GntR family transcriptional regulator [Sediminibacillus halophilus]SDM58798.1 DNA-binding transcriptional regulator, LacI/PurR family [Sediminibacillus halophilus]